MDSKQAIKLMNKRNTFITKYGEIVKVISVLDKGVALCVSLDSGHFIHVLFRDLGIPDKKLLSLIK